MASQEQNKEKQKQMLAGVLFVLLAVVFYFQDPFGLFTNEDETPPTAAAATKPSPTPKGSPAPKKPGQADEPIVTNLLPIHWIQGKPTPLDGSGRNIFVYPSPTPLPTPKPTQPPPTPAPPPITLVGINPAGVIARTAAFPLAVTGLKFPRDAVIYLDGREVPTEYLDESHLKGAISGELFRTPGNLGIQVRSRADANMYSQQVSLNVAEPPAPPYRYVGLIVSRDGSVAVLKSLSDDEVINVRKDSAIGTGKRWKVLSISSEKIEMMDTHINVSHSIAFTGDNDK